MSYPAFALLITASIVIPSVIGAVNTSSGAHWLDRAEHQLRLTFVGFIAAMLIAAALGVDKP